MILSVLRKLTLLIISWACTFSQADVLFDENFDTGGMQLNYTWKTGSGFDAISQGVGDLFEFVTADSHSGNYSLRFNYNGRNGICNTCGRSSHVHKTGLDGVNYFVSDSGEDLTSIDSSNKGPHAAPGRLVYNKSDGDALWEIVSIENHSAVNDKLTLRLLKSGIRSNPRNNFQSGDVVEIARECGVDGNFHNTMTDLRDNCDQAINYFSGVEGSQLPGQSIFRRFYFKVETPKPSYQTKFYFWVTRDDNNQYRSIYLNLQTTSQIFPDYYPLVELAQVKQSTPYIFGPGDGFPSDVIFKRGVWYYVEEEYKASTSGNQNGEYRLWFGESGKEPVNQADHLLEVTGLNLDPVYNTSLFGNISTQDNRYGHLYFDDISISHSWNGPVRSDLRVQSIPPPKPPVPDQ
ncbi:MAG: hypothetical protein KJO91_08335 [Gammaproteobacteria bacterium]|nr:hypothetical protein [Gammaproteobacteria bacterium]